VASGWTGAHTDHDRSCGHDDEPGDFEVADDKSHSSRNLVDIDSENSGMLGII